MTKKGLTLYLLGLCCSAFCASVNAVPIDSNVSISVDIAYSASLDDRSPPPANLTTSPEITLTTGGISSTTAITGDSATDSGSLTELGDGVAGVLDAALLDGDLNGTLLVERLIVDLTLANLSPTQSYVITLGYELVNSGSTAEGGAFSDSYGSSRFTIDNITSSTEPFRSEILINGNGFDEFRDEDDNIVNAIFDRNLDDFVLAEPSELTSTDSAADTFDILLPAASTISMQAIAAGSADANTIFNISDTISFDIDYSLTVEDVTAVAMNEPVTLTLFFTGLLAIGAMLRLKKSGASSIPEEQF